MSDEPDVIREKIIREDGLRFLYTKSPVGWLLETVQVEHYAKACRVRREAITAWLEETAQPRANPNG